MLCRSIPAALAQVRHKIQTLRVELYATRLDAFRLFLEVVLTLYIAALAAAELRSMYRVGKGCGGTSAHSPCNLRCHNVRSGDEAAHAALFGPPTQVARLTGGVLSYFTSGWHAMDFASTCLLVACCTMWWVLVWRHAIRFAIDLRFNVYQDLGADAAYLALEDGGAGLQAMHAAFSRLQVCGSRGIAGRGMCLHASATLAPRPENTPPLTCCALCHAGAV